MKILNNRQFYLPDPKFVHLASIQDGLLYFMCFRESPDYFNRRRVMQPFPTHPQVWIEQLNEKMVGSERIMVGLKRIDSTEQWNEIAALLLEEEIIEEKDLGDHLEDVKAVYTARGNKATKKLARIAGVIEDED